MWSTANNQLYLEAKQHIFVLICVRQTQHSFMVICETQNSFYFYCYLRAKQHLCLWLFLSQTTSIWQPHNLQGNQTWNLHVIPPDKSLHCYIVHVAKQFFLWLCVIQNTLNVCCDLEAKTTSMLLCLEKSNFYSYGYLGDKR